MGKVKRLTLDRYEHGLLVRALYEEWHRMLEREEPTEDMEDLILKVIMIIGWRKQSLLRLFSLPNDTFGSE